MERSFLIFFRRQVVLQHWEGKEASLLLAVVKVSVPQEPRIISLELRTTGLNGPAHLVLLKALNATKNISRLIALLLLDLLVFNASHDFFHFGDHLKRAFVLECGWIRVEQEILK